MERNEQALFAESTGGTWHWWYDSEVGPEWRRTHQGRVPPSARGPFGTRRQAEADFLEQRKEPEPRGPSQNDLNESYNNGFNDGYHNGKKEAARQPVPMILTCPSCCARHVDQGKFATKVHHTHACQSCGACWRPAIVPTVGVQFLPGFKDEVSQ